MFGGAASFIRVALIAVLVCVPPTAFAVQINSPDTRISVLVDVDENGAPHYSIRYRGRVIIGESRLGIRFADHEGLDSGFRIVDSERGGNDSVWQQPWGERRRVRDHHNELFVRFEARDPQREFGLRIRVHDDGVGFRYEVPKQRYYDKVAIVDEITEFRLPQDATAWWVPGFGWNRFEYIYKQTQAREVPLAVTPMTLRTKDGVHVSIHEAALVDYAGFVLDQRRDGIFKTNLTPWSDGIRVKLRAPFVTPWRTIQIAPAATGLLNSDLILNLNEPNKLGDVSWVEPGKYVGIWWAMHIEDKTWGSGPDHGATTDETRRYIDFAAKNGFDGVLVEGWNTGWDGSWFHNGAIFSFTESYPDFDIEAVADYALKRGVRLIGHHETSGHITNYENQVIDAYDLYESLGVRQIKTGYVADGGGLMRIDNGVLKYEWHDGQFSSNHHIKVLEEAAKRKISINSHEPVKDTGLRRTYPNWLSREGARGQEFNAWGNPVNPPDHNVTLVYTRMLSGPMDFTPGIFDLSSTRDGVEYRVKSTLAHQLALYVVLYSPIQMAADLPENYDARPDAFQFIRDVPTDWEESIALAGEVADYVVFARRERGGQDWYIGAISGNESRNLEVPLSFLSAGKRYRATIYRDGDNAHWESNPYDYVIERKPVTANDRLDLPLAAGGGAAIRIEPAD
jgi:alpha-glucosidase